ncbi:TolB family protein [Geodermatophilus sp. SYSU D01176]
MRRTAVLLASTLGVVPLLAVPAQAGEPVPPFVFASDRDGDAEIHRTLAYGRIRQLTRNDVTDDQPVWSPDGRRIAFVSTRDGNAEVFVMDADGSDVVQVTDTATTPDGVEVRNDSPAWSPDGRTLAFVSNRDDPEGEVYRVAADGTRLQRLTTNPFVTDNAPAWSPDGRHVLYSVTPPADDADLYRMRPDGSQIRQLTDTPDVDESTPEYSPDGRTIAFSRFDLLAGERDLATMRATGGPARHLTGEPDRDEWFPRWTADGRQLAFWAQDGTRSTAWLVDRDGTDLRPLTAGTANDSSPDPRP